MMSSYEKANQLRIVGLQFCVSIGVEIDQEITAINGHISRGFLSVHIVHFRGKLSCHGGNAPGGEVLRQKTSKLTKNRDYTVVMNR